jgi:transposase-like protein
MDFAKIRKLTEDEAREYLENLRWPDGVACVHCGCVDVVKLAGKATRPGVYKCKTSGCRKQFTVTVGTIFERSHVPLKTWLEAFALMCAAKKGRSALELQRLLGLGSYQTAWHMCHRIRYAMETGMFTDPLGGPGKDVMADEMFHGPKPANQHRKKRPGKKGVSRKVAIMGLVEKGGRAIVVPIGHVTKAALKRNLDKYADKQSRLITDEAMPYRILGREFAGGHEKVLHKDGEYARGKGADMISTNEMESFWGLFRRGLIGSYHHVSKEHLARYCNEFAFRWSHRKINDGERTRIALKGTLGRRLTYRQPSRKDAKSVVA